MVAAFARCFASLLYTYRKFLVPAPRDQQKHGFFYKFNTTGFMRSLPHDSVDYMSVLSETQGRIHPCLGLEKRFSLANAYPSLQ